MRRARLLLVVPAGRRADANALAAQMDEDSGGGDTFSIPIGPKNGNAITHYGACGLLQEKNIEAIAKVLLPQFEGASSQVVKRKNPQGNFIPIQAQSFWKGLDSQNFKVIILEE